MSTQEAREAPDIRQRFLKHAGVFALVSSLLNLSLGGFLVWVWMNYHTDCVSLHPMAAVWLLVSAIVACSVGGVFLLYAFVGAVRSCQRSNAYEELEGSESLVDAANPGMLVTAATLFLFFLYLFRLGWLIFGTVEIFHSQCTGSFLVYFGKIYIIIQWGLIGISLLLACSFCWVFLCCAALLARG